MEGRVLSQFIVEDELKYPPLAIDTQYWLIDPYTAAFNAKRVRQYDFRVARTCHLPTWLPGTSLVPS